MGAPLGRLSLTRWVCALALAGLASGCLDSGYVLLDRTGAAGAGGSSNPGSGGAGCDEQFESGTAFAACALSYFGSAESDRLLGAAIGPGGEVFIAGSTGLADLGASSLTAPGASTGVVLRLQGNRLVSAARVGAVVHDVEVTSSSLIAATDQGVFALSFGLDEVVGQATAQGEALRVATSSDSAAALLADGRALLLDATAASVEVLELGQDAIADLALDAELGLLFVTGGHPASAAGACTGSLPFLRAHDLTGAVHWTAYDFADAPDWCASSSGRRLAVGGGKVFYAGEQHGGNSVHLRDPRDLSAQAPLVSYDEFSNGSGKAIQVYAFVGRFDAATGVLETGQVILPRQDMIGGSLSASALAVDELGRVFLGGQVSCCLERREQRSVAGQALGAFAGPEASLLVLSADLRERLAWTSFTGSSASGAEVSAIAVRGSLGVLTATADSSESLLVHHPLQVSPAGSDEGYFVVFPAP